MTQQDVIEFMKTGSEIVARLPKDEDEQPLLDELGLCDILYSMAEGYVQSEMYADNNNIVANSLLSEGVTDDDKIMEEFVKMHLHTVAHRVFELAAGFVVMREVR